MKLCKCSLGSLKVHFSVWIEGLAVITRGCYDRRMVSYECSICGNATVDDACKFVRSPRLSDFQTFSFPTKTIDKQRPSNKEEVICNVSGG